MRFRSLSVPEGNRRRQILRSMRLRAKVWLRKTVLTRFLNRDRKGFFDGYYSPRHDEKGEVIGGVAIIRDVTDRKVAESEALDEHRRSRFSRREHSVRSHRVGP